MPPTFNTEELMTNNISTWCLTNFHTDLQMLSVNVKLYACLLFCYCTARLTLNRQIHAPASALKKLSDCPSLIVSRCFTTRVAGSCPPLMCVIVGAFWMPRSTPLLRMHATLMNVSVKSTLLRCPLEPSRIFLIRNNSVSYDTSLKAGVRIPG